MTDAVEYANLRADLDRADRLRAACVTVEADELGSLVMAYDRIVAAFRRAGLRSLTDLTDVESRIRAGVIAGIVSDLEAEIAWQREAYGDGSDRVATGRLLGMEDALVTVRRHATVGPDSDQGGGAT